MTIRRGEQWGTLQVPAGQIEVVGSDAELRALVVARAAGGGSRERAGRTTIGLAGGDLMRTVGGTGDRSRFTGDQPIPHLPIDLVRVVADEQRETVFVAHLVVRRSWWWGEVTAVMNAQFLDPSRSVGPFRPGRPGRPGRRHGIDAAWDVAPRSHPNDGRFDVLTASADLGVRQRWMARSRLRLGTHLPHPQITVRQHASATLDLHSMMPLWVDGTRWGSARHLRLTIEPDAFTVCV